MSIFFDFEVAFQKHRFRKAVHADTIEIETFINWDQISPLFGDVNIGILIERTTLPLVLMNDQKHVVGFISLCDHPNVSSVDPADWEKWMRNMFGKFFLARDTFFIHFMACNDSITSTFMEEAMLCIYKNDSYLKNIILMVPPSCPIDILLRYLNNNRYRMQRHFPKFSKCQVDGPKPDTLYFYWAKRVDYIPRMKVRSAVEEDNDDIVDILDKNCHDLKERYEAYYISEIIGRHPEMARTIIVGEHRDQVVAVMCINTDINYSMLQITYELKPYCGLVKSSITGRRKWSKDNQLLKTFGEPIMLGQFGPFDHVKKFETLFKDEIQNRRPRSISKKSIDGHHKGGFRLREMSRKFTEITIDRQSQASNIRVVPLDDDQFDYDIVNIDYSLFAMPNVSLDNASLQIERFKQQPQIGKKHTSKQPKLSLEKKDKEYNTISPEFIGDANAFMIELYGVHPDFDERQCFEMLQMAFSKVSNADYCIIRVPTKDKGFSLLQHFSFVPTKEKANSEYALYVAHRNSVLGKIRVRHAEIPDIPQIAKLMYNLDGKDSMWTIENSLRTTSSRHTVFIFQVGVSLIGFAITEPLSIMNNIISTYKIDAYHDHRYHYKEHGFGAGFSVLKTLIAYPAYEPHFRYFARDIMRLCGYHGLFWLTGYRSKMVLQRTNTMISSMVPLLPRKNEIISDIPDLKKLEASKKSTCVVPECEGVDPLDFMPSWWPNSTEDRCTKPLINFTNYHDNETCRGDMFTGEYEKCVHWIYESQNSVVAELNLACQPWKINLVGTIHNIGMLCSMLISGFLTDRFGRKPTLILCVFGGAIGHIKAFATSYYMYATIELLESALSGGSYAAAMVLMVEIGSTDKRILAGVLFAYAIYLGESLFACIAMVVPYWKNLVRIIYTPSLLVPLLFFVIRESPRWQILNNKLDDAKTTIKVAAKINKIDVDLSNTTDDELRKNFEIEKCDKQESVLKIFTSREVMKRLCVGCVCRFTASFVYYGLMINSVWLPGNKYVNFLLSTVMSFPGELVALYLMNKVGRRLPLILGFILSAVMCVGSGYVPEDLTAVKIALFLMGKLVISVSFTGAITYTMELFPTSVRGSLLGICAVYSRVGAMLAPLTPMMNSISPVLASLCFGGSGLLAGFLLLFTPETKDAPLLDTIEQINKAVKLKKDKGINGEERF